MLDGRILQLTYQYDSWSDENENWSKPWIVDAAEGLIYAESGIPISLLVQRCVLDNTLDDYETAPYPDPAGLTWSDLKPYAEWRDAYDYCAELNTEEDTENFWRLPTMEELQTLVRHCEEGYCAIDFSGKSLMQSSSPLNSQGRTCFLTAFLVMTTQLSS